MPKSVKNVMLDDSHIAFVKQVKEEKKLSSFSSTLDMIIAFYQENQKLVDNEKLELFFKEFDERYKAKLFDPIRLRTGYTEKNMQIVIEMLNAVAARLSLSHTSTKYEPTLCFTQARDEVQKTIEANKQKKDSAKIKKKKAKVDLVSSAEEELMEIDFDFLDLTE